MILLYGTPPPDENGRYLVYVSRTGVDADKIEKEFNRRNEFSLSDYQDKATYRRKVGPSVALLAIEKYGMYNSLQLDYGRELFNDELAPIEYELIENYNEFIMNKRTVITDLYGTYNQSFADKFNIASDLVLYEGDFIGDYILYATEDEINHMSKDSSVVEITAYDITDESMFSDIIDDQIHTDSINGTKSALYSHSTAEVGYRGTGMKIGILEAGGYVYDSNAYQLRAIHGNRLNYVDGVDEYLTEGETSIIDADNAQTHKHTSIIASIIVGQCKIIGGRTYEGVVPNAMVYQMPILTSIGVFNGIEILARDYGVTVINYSGGSIERGENNELIGYGPYAKMIDKIVDSTGVVLVAAVGNNVTVASPAAGYNIIAVGNAVTKINTTTAKSIPYQIHGASQESALTGGASAYVEPDYQTNKPDIVAPGAYITYIEPDGTIKMGGVHDNHGTSYAAPFVTGVIAQMFQADETLMGNPTKTKSVLLAGADNTIISLTGNDVAYTGNMHLREASGAGIVNAKRAVEIAKNGSYYGTMFYLNSTATAGLTRSLGTVELTAGQKIRIVLVNNKPDDSVISTGGYAYDTSLSLYLGNTKKKESKLIYSNVEVIEHLATESGTYDIKVKVDRFTLNGQPLQWHVYASWIIFD